MALERLTLSPVILGGSGGDDDHLNKAPRLPRWTRQELLVLIQGKRVAENRVRRGGRTVVVEPKWSSVSSYCKRHGVNRGPVQCRKRWSNLAGDFKKIKEWESSPKDESFWVMRNDLRRERKLPGFFDKEVYDILLLDDNTNTPDVEAAAAGDKSLILSLAPSSSEPDTEVLFDSGRTTSTATAAGDDGLFSDDPITTPTPTPSSDKDAPTPISATQYYDPPFSQTQTQTRGVPPSTAEDNKDKDTTNPSPETDQGRKRKRPYDATNEDDDQKSLQNQLIEAMERNGRLLNSQLEIQNINSQLDREQRKDQANTLFAVLNKLADAMVKIADKL